MSAAADVGLEVLQRRIRVAREFGIRAAAFFSFDMDAVCRVRKLETDKSSARTIHLDVKNIWRPPRRE
jgi:hypothetical protein